MERLALKFEKARELVPAPVVVRDAGSKIGFLAYGSTDCALRESLDQIKKRYGQERIICAFAPVPSPTRFTTSSPRMSASTLSSRIATRSWQACSSSICPPIR